MKEPRGKLVLVTGAGSGIGRATALAFAREGARVICVDIDETSAEKTAAACAEAGAPEAAAYRVDVADADAMHALAEKVNETHGPPDILVNNAGVGMSGRFADMSLEDWRWIRGVNLDGVVHGCMAFGPRMLERGSGHVVNISSGLAYIPHATEAPYVATKAAVLALSRSLRADWGPQGVGVTAICPGVIDTPIIEGTRFVGDDAELRTRARDLFRRGHSPAKVARAIVRSVRRDTAFAPVGIEAWLGWLLHRYGPARMQERIARRALPAALGRGANIRPELAGEAFSVTTDDGATLHGTIAGQGPLVVLAHCWTGSRELWATVGTDLVERGFRVAAYDHRGHGASTPGRDGFTLTRLASDLRCVLEHLDARDAVLAGHSIGGMAIQTLAIEQPEVLERAASIVLVATSARGIRSTRIGPLATRVVGSRIATRAVSGRGGTVFVRGALGPGARRGDVEHTRDLFAACDPTTRGALLGEMHRMDLRGLAGLDVPVTVIIGGRDGLTHPRLGREIAQRLGADLIEVPRAGHMLPLEAPSEVAEAIANAGYAARGFGSGVSTDSS